MVFPSNQPQSHDWLPKARASLRSVDEAILLPLSSQSLTAFAYVKTVSDSKSGVTNNFVNSPEKKTKKWF